MRFPVPKLTGIIFLFGVVVLVLSAYQGLQIPKQRRLIAARQETLETLKSKNRALGEVLSRIKTVGSNQELLKQAVPVSDDVPYLMTQLERVGKDSGVVVRHLGFSVAKKSSGADGEEAKNETVGGAKKISLTVVVTGTYSNLLSFLKNLERTSRVITVTNLKFSPATQEEGEAEGLSATIGVTSYYLEEPQQLSIDTPLDLDLSSPEYVDVIKKVKELRVYEPSVPLP
jgi:Tfp pilus assembly protein PilO